MKSESTSTGRLAACSCGQLTALVRGEPIRISVCHCLACQRRTGSVFGTQARFPRDQAIVRGESRTYTRAGDSGNDIAFHFCPNCGSTVYYVMATFPDIIAIPVGAFADPDFPPPRVSVYESRRHRWVALPADVERTDV